MLIRDFNLPDINWWPEEAACATELVKETLRRARAGTVLDALIYGTVTLGFDSFVFGIVANDRRPDAESRPYILTNQADEWVRIYDQRAFWSWIHARDLAGEPGYAYWEAAQFYGNPVHKAILE